MIKSDLMEEAREQGRIEGRRESIQVVGHARMKDCLPADLLDELNTITDWHDLDRWFMAAGTLDDLDTFRAAVLH